MPMRVVMVDVDGVIVTHPDDGTWHSGLLADLGIDPVMLNDRFFRVHFDDVVLGRADLFERLDLILPSLGRVSAAELVDYWFAHDAHLDHELLAELDQLRKRGVTLHLATVQEHHRARYLWETLRLRDHFDAMHYAAEIGYRKTEPEFYRVIGQRTGLHAAAHCLIDDSAHNVMVARDAGWQALVWMPGMRLADASACWDTGK
jgi:putative hydrolase of the HAD superfamily